MKKSYLLLFILSLIISCLVFYNIFPSQQSLSKIGLSSFASAQDEGGEGDEEAPAEGEEDEEEEEEDSCEPCPCGGYYYCSGSCGGELHYVTPGDPCCDGDCEDIVVETCDGWEMCKDSPPGCFCEGVCLKTPESPRYYNNPTYSDQPNKDVGSNNVKLPLKVDWDDVEGWGQPNGPLSYVINLNSKNPVSNILGESEYNILANHGSCFLDYNSKYNWKVKACCTADGNNCGSSSNWNFETSDAPEPIYPYDPDWEGLEKIGHLNKEESKTLQWCKIEDSDLYREIIIEDEKVYRPLSYKILIYYSEDDLCHEQLELNGQCIPMVLSPETIPVPKESLPPEEFLDDGSFFTKETAYAWKVAACEDDDGQECNDYSQLWRFDTSSWSLEVTLVNPPNDKKIPVGLPVVLRWNSLSANSYNYKLYGVASDKNKTANVVFDYPGLSLNTVYEWTVQPCWDYGSEECEDVWGGPWYFKTTGEPPQLIYPVENDIPIPVNFKWEGVPGAKSYIFKIQGGDLSLERTTEETNLSLDYPDLKQEINYAWQVKTCARENGTVCGNYSSIKTLKTFRLSSPQNPTPEDEGQLFTYQKNPVLYWQKVEGGKFYQYEASLVSISPDETAEDCAAGVLVSQNTTDSPNSTALNLICLGNYEWKVRACLDETCQETGDWSTYSFSFIKKDKPSETGGIVPCGRTDDDPDTSWNERETCQIKHAFLLIRNLIDFVLWTLGPIMLAILVLATGVIFYISISSQNPMPLAKVKSLWKAAGIGYGIILLSWTILNLFLGLIGFRIGIFGNWWQIGF